MTPKIRIRISFLENIEVMFSIQNVLEPKFLENENVGLMI